MKNISKILSLILMVTFSVFLFVGCSTSKEEAKAPSEKTSIEIVVPDGLPAISIVKMIKEKPEISKNLNINYSIVKGSDALVSKVLKGEGDICIVPSNVAAIAYNKGIDYKLAGTVGFGSLYVISSDDLVKKLEDLKGKDIYNVGQGLTPDLIFKIILQNTGINPEKDLTLSYVNAASELAPLFIEGKAKYAVVPEPMLTQIMTKKPDTKIVASLNDQWKEMSDSQMGYPQSSVIVKEDLVNNHFDDVQKILKEIDESTKWANENREEAGSFAEEVGITGKKEIIAKSLERANLNYVSSVDSKSVYIGYYDKIYSLEPKAIGGKKINEEIFLQK
ncbi:PhnD/SsuA/transferrin family substrate-binding protein [Clostridium perfringens]|nr:PhnD/SsuA/transferrin family substrate-binding protein [Clostridium perfringens]